MRKCIAITLLTIAVLATGAHFVLQPKAGTIDYHKAKYLKARNQIDETSFAGRCRRLVHRMTGVWRFRSANADKALRKDFEQHEKALLQCGYLIEHQFVITNKFDAVLLKLVTNGRRLLPEENVRFTRVTGGGKPVLYVIGRRSDIPKWEEAIRRLDAAE